MNVNDFDYIVERMIFLEKDEGYTYHPSYKKTDIKISDTADKNFKKNRTLNKAYFSPRNKKEHEKDEKWEYGWKKLTVRPKWGQIAFDFGPAPGFHIRGIGVENPPGSPFKYTLNWVGPHEDYNKIIHQSK